MAITKPNRVSRGFARLDFTRFPLLAEPSRLKKSGISQLTNGAGRFGGLGQKRCRLSRGFCSGSQSGHITGILGIHVVEMGNVNARPARVNYYASKQNFASTIFVLEKQFYAVVPFSSPAFAKTGLKVHCMPTIHD